MVSEEIKEAVFWGMATGFGVGALKWVWSFFYRRVLQVFGDTLILE